MQEEGVVRRRGQKHGLIRKTAGKSVEECVRQTIQLSVQQLLHTQTDIYIDTDIDTDHI